MFRESLHKLVAYLNDGKAVAREALEGKILNLLEKKGNYSGTPLAPPSAAFEKGGSLRGHPHRRKLKDF